MLGLDCRAVEPTERGFLAAAGFDNVEALATGLGRPAVVTLDHYEVFRLMDTWLRQVLVPALPDGVSLVISGRERPVAGWFALEGFRTLPVAPLEEEEAIAMLEQRGVPRSEASRLNSIARGHPLALTLARPEPPSIPSSRSRTQRSPASSTELSRLYLEDVEDELARRSLEAASVVGGPRSPCSRPCSSKRTAPRRFAACSTCRSSTPAVTASSSTRRCATRSPGFLSGASPNRYRAYRRAAWRALRAEAREAERLSCGATPPTCST